MTGLKQKRDLSWIRIVWPAVMVVIGLIMVVMFFVMKGHGYQFVASLGFMIIGGFILKHNWTKRGEGAGRVIVVESNADKGPQNCLNIYPDKIVFDTILKPEGQPWKCENDGKSYYVNIWSEEHGHLVEFKLPDQSYMDPQVFAQRVLELPAHRRIFRRKQTLLQQLSPLMAFGGAGAVWLLILTTT